MISIRLNIISNSNVVLSFVLNLILNPALIENSHAHVFSTCVGRVAWIPLMCEAVVMCLVQGDPLLPCVRLHARPSARMNMLKGNVKNTCTTGQTVACDQCRIKVFGALG